MKFRTAVRRSTVIVIILVAAVCIGYAYQLIGEILDRKNHPQEFSSIVEKYSDTYGVPEYMLYAVICEESGFQSNKVSENGRIGLFQIHPDMLDWLNGITKQSLGHGLLYDPETNIRCGAYILSYLYTENGAWLPTLAAYEAGQAVVDEWEKIDALVDSAGVLKTIPDEATADFVGKILDCADMYRALYYEGN
ncbi:MAG: lytic transglycosylase domain-containing protein [Clostridia bacterium]|nr:lytic transglycosylase domain-containing protein [Clostridia bacterium]